MGHEPALSSETYKDDDDRDLSPNGTQPGGKMPRDREVGGNRKRHLE